jgi:ABC-type polysaccharide/polyol phosphate transport system ATPase subunit
MNIHSCIISVCLSVAYTVVLVIKYTACNIHLCPYTSLLSLYVLLDRTTLRLLQGHVYGLVGRNGVGKSTLLRKISSGTLPGFPPHLKVAQVMQVGGWVSE